MPVEMPVDSRLIHRLKRRRRLVRAIAATKRVAGLSYGRHRGPARVASRLAAVAVMLYQEPNGEWTIPLTLRPASLQHHGGQVCLPGGRVEPDEEVYAAAVREFEEELGIPPPGRPNVAASYRLSMFTPATIWCIPSSRSWNRPRSRGDRIRWRSRR